MAVKKELKRLLEQLRNLAEDDAEARALKRLGEIEGGLRGLKLLELDTDALAAQMKGSLTEMIDDPEKARKIFTSEKVRRTWAEQLRLLASKMDDAVAGLAKAVSYFEVNPADPEQPSGFAYDVSALVKALQDKAAELRRDADELEKL